MKGFSDQFVEGIVKRAIRGTISSKEAATKLGISILEKFLEMKIS